MAGLIMVGLLWTIVVVSFVVAVAYGVSANHDVQPYVPQQFSNPLMSRYASAALIYEPRIPLDIQFKALCSNISICVTFASATLLAFLTSENGALVVLFMVALSLFGLISAVRKYSVNRAQGSPHCASDPNNHDFPK
jgi:hypothetical protein